jgi:hypothetical protein
LAVRVGLPQNAHIASLVSDNAALVSNNDLLYRYIE